jgi:hypothetical protein
MSESVTILRARGRRLAKLILPDGTIRSYDAAKTFDMESRTVADLATLGAVLESLLPRPDCAVVRGQPVGPVHRVRRLVHPDAKTGEAATLLDSPRRWLALDMEGIALPAHVPAADLAACGRLALETLPCAFAEAACIVQASGSHGFKPDLRLRLWFWCARPMAGAELKRWLRATPADLSVFSGAQVIYTAAPVMAGGGADPLPARLAWLPGAPELSCPAPEALAPRPRPAARPMRLTGEGASRYARKALRSAVTRILTAPKRHPVILAEARGLARLVRGGLLPEADMRQAIHAAAAERDKPADEIDAVIGWALLHPANGSLPEIRHG